VSRIQITQWYYVCALQQLVVKVARNARSILSTKETTRPATSAKAATFSAAEVASVSCSPSIRRLIRAWFPALRFRSSVSVSVNVSVIRVRTAVPQRRFRFRAV